MKRRIKAFEYANVLVNRSGGIPIGLFIDLLSTLPTDTTIVGSTFDNRRNSYLMFFSSESWDVIPMHDVIPTFVPTFKENEDGTITLINNGIEEGEMKWTK